MRRTQLYLTDEQYRWLKREGGPRGVASVVRRLVDAARSKPGRAEEDPLIAFLLEAPTAGAGRRSSVQTLDDDVYGA